MIDNANLYYLPREDGSLELSINGGITICLPPDKADKFRQDIGAPQARRKTAKNTRVK